MRREGDKLTPRINTLTRRDSWRERDPYASPYRRDPYRRDPYREQPNSARSDAMCLLERNGAECWIAAAGFVLFVVSFWELLHAAG